MSAIPRPKLTPAEYLEAERLAHHKSEFFRGEIFAIPHNSREHNRIKENLVGELYFRLKGGLCQTFSSDQRVLVEANGI